MRIAFFVVTAAVIAAVYFMWREPTKQSHANNGAAKAGTNARDQRDLRALRAGRARPAPEAPPEIPGLPTELAEAHVAVEMAARSCYSRADVVPAAEPGAPDETIESLTIEYRAVAVDGRGRPEGLRIIETGLTRGDLEQCIVAAATGAEWESSGDGHLGTLTQEINLGDLLKPIGPPPEHERSPRPTAPPPGAR